MLVVQQYSICGAPFSMAGGVSGTRFVFYEVTMSVQVAWLRAYQLGYTQIRPHGCFRAPIPCQCHHVSSAFSACHRQRRWCPPELELPFLPSPVLPPVCSFDIKPKKNAHGEKGGAPRHPAVGPLVRLFVERGDFCVSGSRGAPRRTGLAEGERVPVVGGGVREGCGGRAPGSLEMAGCEWVPNVELHLQQGRQGESSLLVSSVCA